MLELRISNQQQMIHISVPFVRNLLNEEFWQTFDRKEGLRYHYTFHTGI